MFYFVVEMSNLGVIGKGVLIERNIEKLYILSKDYNDFFKYQERNLPNILANNNLSAREKSHAVYHVAKSLTKEILNKPGKLTIDEFGILKRHSEAGYKLLKDKENIEEESLKAVIQHHENYDDTGYPHGIGGKEIDLYGRLARIIDVYDAITTKRCYASAMNPFTALKEMGESMDNCFDMEILKNLYASWGLGVHR